MGIWVTMYVVSSSVKHAKQNETIKKSPPSNVIAPTRCQLHTNQTKSAVQLTSCMLCMFKQIIASFGLTRMSCCKLSFKLLLLLFTQHEIVAQSAELLFFSTWHIHSLVTRHVMRCDISRPDFRTDALPSRASHMNHITFCFFCRTQQP